MSIRSIAESRPGLVTEIVTESHDPERVVIATTQDVQPVIDMVKARAELPMDSEMKPIAEIPMAIVERMIQEGSWNDPVALKRWLNDPQNSVFRVYRGRV